MELLINQWQANIFQITKCRVIVLPRRVVCCAAWRTQNPSSSICDTVMSVVFLIRREDWILLQTMSSSFFTVSLWFIFKSGFRKYYGTYRKCKYLCLQALNASFGVFYLFIYYPNNQYGGSIHVKKIIDQFGSVTDPGSSAFFWPWSRGPDTGFGMKKNLDPG